MLWVNLPVELQVQITDYLDPRSAGISRLHLRWQLSRGMQQRMCQPRVWGSIFQPSISLVNVLSELRRCCVEYRSACDLLLLGMDLDYLYFAKTKPEPQAVTLTLLVFVGGRFKACPTSICKYLRPSVYQESSASGVKAVQLRPTGQYRQKLQDHILLQLSPRMETNRLHCIGKEKTLALSLSNDELHTISIDCECGPIPSCSYTGLVWEWGYRYQIQMCGISVTLEGLTQDITSLKVPKCLETRRQSTEDKRFDFVEIE